MDEDRTFKGWSLETHNIALTALNKIEMHGEECTRRQLGIDRAHTEIKQSIKDLGAETTKSVQEIKEDVKKINIRMGLVLGGVYAVARLIEWGWVTPHLAKATGQ